jgi:hypothetical protein
MHTPAGTECRYYYEDYFRGRSVQECRLLRGSGDSPPWEPRVCAICPVPAILRANACPHMTLRARLLRRWFRRRVQVTAFCEHSNVVVKNPYLGCGHCHPDAAALLAPERRET